MDDISSMINEVVNNPEAMNQISQLAASLGLGGASAKNSEENVPFNKEPEHKEPEHKTNVASGVGSGEASSPFSGIDLNTIMVIKNVLEKLNQKDENVELLKALKVHFSPKRAKKVDDAIKIMGLLKLLPILKESGILNLGGGGK